MRALNADDRLRRFHSYFSHLFSPPPDSFDAFGRDLFSAVYESVGWDPREGEGYLTAMLRALVLGRVGSYGLKAAVAEAQKRFAQHCDGTKVIPAGENRVVAITLRRGGE